MSLNVAIIGPGRSKQGTGPYIARTFHSLGANISGVVSSSLESAKDAAKNLNNEYAINCQAYTNLTELFESRRVDIVAICSPNTTHEQYLLPAIEAGCHIFCEKPLWWPATKVATFANVQHICSKTIKLVQLCSAHHVILQLNTQWPFTLPTYYEIFPQLGDTENTIETYSMWLSPQSDGRDMVIDATPHLLSMLYSIVGGGRIQNIKSNSQSTSPSGSLNIDFEYLHAKGDTQVSLSLNSTNTTPKPAAYAINDMRVDRHVELPNYLISLHSSDKQLPVEDPLVCSIKNFLSSIHSKSSSDEVTLIDGMAHLAQIYQAVT